MILLGWKLLVLAKIKNVPHRRQQLSLCDGMKIFIVKQLLSRLPNVKKNKYLSIVLQRIISKMPAALYQHALALVAIGQCAAAAQQLQLAIGLGHLPSRALMAHMLSGGREGVVLDENGAFELVEKGTKLGCHHCQGVLAECYKWGIGCVKNEAQSLELARESSRKGSRYGQYTLANFYDIRNIYVEQNYTKALELYQLSVAQNFDAAQNNLGYMYEKGFGVTQDYSEARRLYQIAATQGCPVAMFNFATLYNQGQDDEDDDKVIYWMLRSQAAFRGDVYRH
jgi:TPR repeat protein